MGKPSPPRGRRPRRGRRKPNAELLRQIGEELAEFRDGPPEGTFDFGDPVEISEMSRRERMLRVLWDEALDGDLKAMQMILDYTDGRPVQAMEVNASVRFTSDEYAKADRKLAAWRETMAGAVHPEGLPAQPGEETGGHAGDHAASPVSPVREMADDGQ